MDDISGRILSNERKYPLYFRKFRKKLTTFFGGRKIFCFSKHFVGIKVIGKIFGIESESDILTGLWTSIASIEMKNFKIRI